MPDEPSGAIAVIVCTIGGCVILAGIVALAVRVLT